MGFLFTCRTDGSGHWTKRVADVFITEIEIAYLNHDNLIDSTHGELRVHFDVSEWDRVQHNVIYTDGLFLRMLREKLKGLGFSDMAVKDIDYSEYGMQGMSYVSLDIGGMFIRECDNFIRFTKGQSPIPQIKDNHR